MTGYQRAVARMLGGSGRYFGAVLNRKDSAFHVFEVHKLMIGRDFPRDVKIVINPAATGP
ncbi:MAG: hypothetical protein WC764_04750 [Candidatus Paceibacterota bacterium]